MLGLTPISVARLQRCLCLSFHFADSHIERWRHSAPADALSSLQAKSSRLWQAPTGVDRRRTSKTARRTMDRMCTERKKAGLVLNCANSTDSGCRKFPFMKILWYWPNTRYVSRRWMMQFRESDRRIAQVEIKCIFYHAWLSRSNPLHETTDKSSMKENICNNHIIVCISRTKLQAGVCQVWGMNWWLRSNRRDARRS